MGTTKSEGFSTEHNRKAAVFKALGHPARVAIVELLLKKQACICGDLVDELPLSQSTVSQHLKELKAAGIIKGEIEGTSICYCINEQVWNELQTEMGQLFASYKNTGSCC